MPPPQETAFRGTSSITSGEVAARPTMMRRWQGPTTARTLSAIESEGRCVQEPSAEVPEPSNILVGGVQPLRTVEEHLWNLLDEDLLDLLIGPGPLCDVPRGPTPSQPEVHGR